MSWLAVDRSSSCDAGRGSNAVEANDPHPHYYLPRTGQITSYTNAARALRSPSNPRLFARLRPLTMAQSTAHRRLLQEYRALTNNPPDGITAGPVSEDDLLHWECLIQGPEGTPFEGGVFPAELKFPKDYPLAPPSMKFLADMWHPNGERENAGRALVY